MSKTIAADSDSFQGNAAASTVPASTMHRPQHGVLDTAETAAFDEILHEAALRESALRPPR